MGFDDFDDFDSFSDFERWDYFYGDDEPVSKRGSQPPAGGGRLTKEEIDRLHRQANHYGLIGGIMIAAIAGLLIYGVFWFFL